jgi:hypothetical protein
MSNQDWWLGSVEPTYPRALGAQGNRAPGRLAPRVSSFLVGSLALLLHHRFRNTSRSKACFRFNMK